ncbi:MULTISPECIES: hypothetical protein [unclassified Paenibacillus]|uniref:hypothetical protein n=1 Tax=unclassified Paenibacillus TaxID=185978 RepID=UPI002405F698|nr:MULTISPECIES: hypothetical protein [unclassified Paenibacillus]MDF9840348.1 ABC-type glycerol-3-phosphate transport system substrate-binding protein [Paenibacillus sp. PastF-2]MDF9846930.1 ABC-type glycerol-3-phosphate transport system substrate-binding protein [Paenibacillus sp. PastM-2]MDF9853502.1 ABC-type glycerol-3-phosphate transport system substrate-binding protein [Paenibacillus sp. PastF-1]MDH6479012.1 ABC-type glycerol-3-phosphate transport system substrate-binding protein [Paeniba
MNTSSFLCGVVLGAAASMIMSRKRSAMMSSLMQSGGQLQGAGEKARDKIVGMALTGFGSTAADGSHDKADITEHKTSSQTGHREDPSLKSRESNLNMLKDFIRTNPDVKHEVEQILKDTHTVIPGL